MKTLRESLFDSDLATKSPTIDLKKAVGILNHVYLTQKATPLEVSNAILSLIHNGKHYTLDEIKKHPIDLSKQILMVYHTDSLYDDQLTPIYAGMCTNIGLYCRDITFFFKNQRNNNIMDSCIKCNHVRNHDTNIYNETYFWSVKLYDTRKEPIVDVALWGAFIDDINTSCTSRYSGFSNNIEFVVLPSNIFSKLRKEMS